MRKSYTYRSQALRFRRWSRKAYAAFISVQRAVTIGQLSFSVADRFEKKNQSLHTGIGTFTDGFSEEDDEERENTEENKRSLAVSHGLFTALLPVLVSNEIAHPAHRVAHYTLYNIVKAGSIRKNTSRLSYFHLVVETGRAPSLQPTGIYISFCFLAFQTEYPTAPINNNKIINELKEVT